MSSPREKIEARIRAGLNMVPERTNGAAENPFAFLERYKMTDEEAQAIADPTWIEPGLIPESHVVAFVAPPNGGKTTIIFHLSRQWARAGRSVVFVHADTNPSDAKRMLEIAQSHGIHYLTPDMKVGMGMSNVVDDLKKLAASDVDLSGHIWVFDTLKKMTNVIQKEALRQILMMLRKLSARGMTCILLAHTNKYKNQDGEYQYEGTGDLEADVDELIYFEPQENPDGSLTVSSRCTKRRAEITPMTWTIHRNRTVTQQAEYVDVAAAAARKAQMDEDQPTIEAITDALADGPRKQTEVITHCRDMRFTEKRVRTVLRRYTGELWKAEKLFEKNAWRYELLQGRTAIPAFPLPNCRTGGTDKPSADGWD